MSRIPDALLEIAIAVGVSLIPAERKAKIEKWLRGTRERNQTNALLNLKARAADGDVEAQQTLAQLSESLKAKAARGDRDARKMLHKLKF